jgi:hypothetical protein
MSTLHEVMPNSHDSWKEKGHSWNLGDNMRAVLSRIEKLRPSNYGDIYGED